VPPAIRAVTFDWYGTLARHRGSIGRTRAFQNYLDAHGLSAEWYPRIIYDVFEYYADAYSPSASAGDKRAFWIEFTKRLFRQASVRGMAVEAADHADAVRDIFGATCFELFPEVPAVLAGLRERGLRLAIVSNWQRGLHHFCHELDVAASFDAIISSADVAAEKPDPRIFAEALRRLGVSPADAIHVGDTIRDDVDGARAAGMHAVLVDREDAREYAGERVRQLGELLGRWERYSLGSLT
jgi:putative hydrolase of the HAD superfamily